MRQVTRLIQTAVERATGTEGQEPLVIGFEPNRPVRSLMMRAGGITLILIGAGIWLMPGAFDDSDLMLFKAGASVPFLLFGFALFLRDPETQQPDAYFDPERGEVRVQERRADGRAKTVLRHSYDSISKVDFGKRSVSLYDDNGSLLMKLFVEDPQVRKALRAQLIGLAGAMD